jgi:hypothetical protein
MSIAASESNVSTVSTGARQYQAATSAALKLSEIYKSDKNIMDILFCKVKANEGTSQVESGIKQTIACLISWPGE